MVHVEDMTHVNARFREKADPWEIGTPFYAIRFSATLEKARIRLEITSEELIRRTGLPATVILPLLQGYASIGPTKTQLEAIASALEVSPNELRTAAYAAPLHVVADG